METKKLKVLFIGGLPRSGSTLIETVLNEIPGTLAVGETLHMWERGLRDNELCGCGKNFDSCEMWTQVGESAFGGWDKIDHQRMIDLRWSVDRTRRIPEIIRAHHAGYITAEQDEYVENMSKVLHAAAEANPGTEVILESSKHLTTAALLSLDPLLDVRVLHVVRDPRGVAYSWTKKVKRPEAEDDYMPTYPVARTAFRWVTDNIGFEVLGRQIQQETIKYEDFLADPDSAIRKTLKLAGLDDQMPLPFLTHDEVTISKGMHSVAGNPMRFSESKTVEFRRDEAWRENLTWPKEAQITGIAAPLLIKYGYSIN